jgi:hypothetical protein
VLLCCCAAILPGESVKVAVEYMQPLHYDAESNNYVLQLPTHVPVRIDYASVFLHGPFCGHVVSIWTALLIVDDRTEDAQRSHTAAIPCREGKHVALHVCSSAIHITVAASPLGRFTLDEGAPRP